MNRDPFWTCCALLALTILLPAASCETHTHFDPSPPAPTPTPSPTPPPTPVPPPVQDAGADVDAGPKAADCASVCARRLELGCADAQPTPKGVTCEQVCKNVLASGFVHWDLECRSHAKSCDAGDACER